MRYGVFFIGIIALLYSHLCAQEASLDVLSTGTTDVVSTDTMAVVGNEQVMPVHTTVVVDNEQMLVDDLMLTDFGDVMALDPAELEKLEETNQPTVKDKIRLIWTYVMIKLGATKEVLKQWAHDLYEDTMLVWDDVIDRLVAASNTVTVHVAEHKKKYITGLIVVSLITTGLIIYWYHKSHQATPNLS